MSFMDFLSSGLTAASGGAAGYMQGQDAGRKEADARALAIAAQLRQKHLDEQNALMQSAQIGNLNAETQARLAPKPAEPFTLAPGARRYNPDGSLVAEGAPDEETFTGQPYATVINGKPAQAIRGTKGTIKVLEGQSPYNPPSKDAAPKYQLLKDDATGKYSRVRVDGPEGPISESFVRTGQGGGVGRINNLNEAANTLASANKDATAFEDEILKGTGGFGTLSQIAANYGLDQTKHPMAGPLAAKALAVGNPDFLRYKNSIIAAANAGMMLPGVRASDVRQKKEELLAGLVAATDNPDAMKSLIGQVRQWRADMFAGINQTREQQGMLRGDKGTPSGQSFKSLDPTSQLMASRDPAYRQSLIDRGVTGVP